MGHYSKKKKLSGFCITYFHDSQNCLKCKLAMKSDLQIGRPLKKRMWSTDIIQPEVSKFLVEAKELFKEAKFQLSKLSPAKPLNKVSLKKKVKNTHLMPAKKIINTPRKKIVLKKKILDKVRSKKVENFKFDTEKKNLKAVKSIKQRHVMPETVKSNSVKKSPKKPVDKVKGSKIPGKGTLKRKRWICDQYKQENENHEDDMYELKKFEHFRRFFGEESNNSEKYDELKTPDFPFCLSPRETTPSPTYKDCYDPATLSKYRSRAEEYLHKRQKKMKASRSENKTEHPPPVEWQPGRDSDVVNTLEQAVKLLDVLYNNNEKAVDTVVVAEDRYLYDLQGYESTVDSG